MKDVTILSSRSTTSNYKSKENIISIFSKRATIDEVFTDWLILHSSYQWRYVTKSKRGIVKCDFMYYIRIILYLSFSFLVLNSSPFSVIPSIYQTYKTKLLQNQSFKNCELACHLKMIIFEKKLYDGLTISRGNAWIFVI